MVGQPLFATSLHVEAVDGEGIFLLSERGQRVLTGSLAWLVASQIDGHRSVDQIVELLSERVPAAEVYYTLMVLESEGLLVDADVEAAREPAGFWEALGQDPRRVEPRPPEVRVSLASFGGVESADFTSALSALHVQVGGDGDFVVALTDDYLQPGLDAVNAAALKSGLPWLICKPVGTILWLGPLFQPGKTGCWECLAARLRVNRPLEGYLQRRMGRPAPILAPKPTLPSSLQTGLSLAATETARWLACGQSALEGALMTLDLATLTSERHRLVRRPQCPRCGDSEYRSKRQPQPVHLQRRPRQSGADVEERSLCPEATLSRYGHHVSGITGIVSEFHRVSVDDAVVAVYAAASNGPGLCDGDSFAQQRLRGLSAGKGLTKAQARASALCEALERHSGRFEGYESRARASYFEFAEKAVHPNSCMLFSEQQYQQREAWNARGSRLHFVPEPFDPACTLDWAPTWSLTRRDWRYLPAQYCYYDYPAERGRRFCRADSNGNAAGNNLEEAILHGFLELVERDCVAIWWYNRLKRPSVDLDSFHDPHIEGLRRHYRAQGREVWLLDVTNDLGIPVFVAVSRRTDSAEEELIMGFGAHFNPHIAVLQALSEMSQFLAAVRNWDTMNARDLAVLDPEPRRWLQTATIAGQAYLAPDETVPPRPAGDAPAAGDDLLDDIERCRQIVERQSMELLVLDQTRPDVGLPVVKVIVPGLRHFWPRFAPGRLYDVPVRLGWLEESLGEDDLNPIPMFL